MTTLPLKRLEQGIGWGLVVLVAVMPFHAFLSVWLGSLLGHQSLIQAWKELLAVILVMATTVIVYREPDRLRRGGQALPLAALAFVMIALLVTLLHPQSLSAVVYGIKTDFEFMALFFVALYGTNGRLYLKFPSIILVTCGIVAAFGILHATVLPHDFLTHFGYGPNTIAPFEYVGSLSDTIRTPSTLGGPNQLGSFLVLPLCLAVVMFLKRPRWSLTLAIVLYSGALWYTYSRSAWLGAVAGIGLTIAALVHTRRQAARLAIGATVLVILAVAALSLGNHSVGLYQYFVLHSGAGVEDNNSTTQHAAAFTAGLTAVRSQPIGNGLGSAGPASFHAANKLIPENYYLQVAIETSILGLIAFLAFISFAAVKLWGSRHQHELYAATFGALVGLSIVNLFLHGWADSSTAFIFWIVAGAVLAGDRRYV